MFVSGKADLNSVAKAADSTVALTPNCGFYFWTEQMYLWLLSPAPASYGGGSRIMFSPKFFTVTPEDSSGRRSFIRNNPAGRIQMMLRKTELGPHGLPAVLSRSGHVIEVERPQTGVTVAPTVRSQTGAQVPITSIRRETNGALRLFNQSGAEVLPSRLALPIIQRPVAQIATGQLTTVVPLAAVNTAIQARKFVLNNIPIFVDKSGNIIDVEPNQADNGVLISQNGSLIYYITVTNDVYAYHRTMQGAALTPPNTNLTFPMTTADGNAVKAFAATKGHTILEPQALAIESKSSWIEASAVSNPADYVQVTATVPTFNKSDPNRWVENGQKEVKLVMVGMHVVGSTNGHGEMVWGTVEHAGNAPNATYMYNSTSGQKTVTQNTAGNWAFTPSNFAGPFNANQPFWSGSEICGSPGGPPCTATVKIVPVLRVNPWGKAGNNVSSNTQVISANANVLKELASGDVRRNYFQVGTTWTIGGAAPNGGNEVGTNQLANATIETFMQGSNCFSCHTTNKVSVSHIYSQLKPVP